MSNEFPRLLYRRAVEGHAEEVWGVMCNLLTVEDADELDAALEEGWSVEPPVDAAPAPAASVSEFSLLDEKVAVIVEHLPALTDDELAALLDAEKRGKTRKGVIEALEEAIEARKAPPPAEPPAE